MTDKLKSGDRLPDITVPQHGGGELQLGLYVSQPLSEKETCPATTFCLPRILS